jgi:predicted transglutaminase-like cysteine proteinase
MTASDLNSLESTMRRCRIARGATRGREVAKAALWVTHSVVIDELGAGHAVLRVRTDRGNLILGNKRDAVLP